MRSKIIILITLLASLITIFVFVTGKNDLSTVLRLDESSECISNDLSNELIFFSIEEDISKSNSITRNVIYENSLLTHDLFIDSVRFRTKSTLISDLNGYAIEAKLEKKHGSNDKRYGLIWGYDDVSRSFYLFSVFSNGTYQIDLIKNGEWNDLTGSLFTSESVKSNYIKKGNSINFLGILKQESTTYFYVNFHLVGCKKDLLLFGNRVGFLAESGIEVKSHSITIQNNRF